MEVVLLACAAFVVYAYAGYPLVLCVVARLFGRPVRQADITPSVTFVIAARNEASRIRAKIENTLALDYPLNLFEVIVASDCSDDGTDDIVREFAPQGVRLIAAPERLGKENAQSLAIRESAGEVLVFSDASTRLEPGGVKLIVRNFADPEIGCVSSVDRVVDAEGRPGGEGAYVRYEMWLRSLESRVGSVVGLSGSFFAARRDVCEPWPTDLPSDFNTLLNTLRRGLRGVSDPAAIGSYLDLADPAAEYARKVRTVSRGLSSLGRNVELLNPFAFGTAAWQLFSHKLCRWLVPFALAGVLATNLSMAWQSTGYAAVGVCQLLCYGVAAYGIRRGVELAGPLRLLTFFVLVNFSILNAWYNVLRGRRVVVWQPSRR